MQETQELLDDSRDQEREKERDEGDLAEDDQQDSQSAWQEVIQPVDHRQGDIGEQNADDKGGQRLEGARNEPEETSQRDDHQQEARQAAGRDALDVQPQSLPRLLRFAL